MIRIIVRTEDVAACVHANAKEGQIDWATFDYQLNDLEHFLAKVPTYGSRKVVGVEVVFARTPEVAVQNSSLK